MLRDLFVTDVDASHNFCNFSSEILDLSLPDIVATVLSVILVFDKFSSSNKVKSSFYQQKFVKIEIKD